MGQLLALFDILTVALLIAGCLLIWGGLRPQNAILLQEPATPTIQVIPPKEVTSMPPRRPPPTQVMMRPFQQLHNRYPMTFLANARRRFQRFSPYLSLLVLLVPLLLVEPLKIAALFVAGKGHWITGTGILVGAYIVSLFFVERLFKVMKPKLLMLPWFAQLWRWYETARDKTITVVTGQPR